MNVDEYWAQLKATGWLKSVPSAHHKALKLRIAKALKSGDGWRGLVTGGYDNECIENDGDYVRLLVAYSEASYGKFMPQSIKDSLDIESGKATIRFTLEGRSFRRSFEQDGDTVSDEFDSMLNGILEKVRIAERFFQLPSDDQVARLTFVRPAALRKAVAAGLVPAETLGETEEDDDDDIEPWKPFADSSGRLRGRLTRAQVVAQPFQVWNEFCMLCGNPSTRIPYAALTPTQRPAWLAYEYLYLMSAESEPDSHRHYFARVPPAHIAQTASALRLLGADVHYRVLGEAKRRFAAGTRHHDYSDLDATFRHAEPNIEHYLEEYLAQHEEEFVLIEE